MNRVFEVMKLRPLNMHYNMTHPIASEGAWAHTGEFTSLVLPSNTTCNSLGCKWQLLCGSSLPMLPTVGVDEGMVLNT